MYTINKSFDFCYGHRIWNQKLPAPQVCKCRRLHEHESCVEVNLQSQKLMDGMVLDFNHLKPVKEFIDEVIDHKFFMDIDDPLLKQWLNMCHLSFEDLDYQESDTWWVCSSEITQPKSVAEWLHSLVIVDFVPTSENLSRWLNQQVRKMLIMPREIEISVGITWHESAKSCASYVVHP